MNKNLILLSLAIVSTPTVLLAQSRTSNQPVLVKSQAGIQQDVNQEFSRLRIQIREEANRTVANPPSAQLTENLIKRSKILLDSPNLNAEQREFLATAVQELRYSTVRASVTPSRSAMAFNRCFNSAGDTPLGKDFIEWNGSSNRPKFMPSSSIDYVDPKTNKAYRITSPRPAYSATYKGSAYDCTSVRVGSTNVDLWFHDYGLYVAQPCYVSMNKVAPERLELSVEEISAAEIARVAPLRANYLLDVTYKDSINGDFTRSDRTRALDLLNKCYDYLTPENRTRLNDVARRLPNYPCGNDLMGPDGSCLSTSQNRAAPAERSR